MIDDHAALTIRPDATRHLCAGVFFDRAFRNVVIRRVHNDAAHRTAPSYGFDLVAVVHKAWQAWVQETVQLAAMAAVLVAVLAWTCTPCWWPPAAWASSIWPGLGLRAAPEIVRLHARASGERLLRRRGMVDHDRRRERSRLLLLCGSGCAILAAIAVSAARTAHDPSRQVTGAVGLLGVLAVIAAGAGAVRQVTLNRIRWRPVIRPDHPRGRLGIIKAQQESVYVIYHRSRNEKSSRPLSDPCGDDELTPFVGSGILVHRWPSPLNVQLLRPGEGSMDDREHQIPPFQAHELVQYLKKAMSPAGEDPGRLHGFQIEDRLYIAETEVPADRGFLRDPCRQEDIDEIIDEPYGSIRHYLEIRLTIAGELVTTAFVRVSLRGRSLSLDFSACALTRTPAGYHLLDFYGETGPVAVIRSAIRNVCAIPVTVGSLWRLAEVPWVLAGAMRARKDRTLLPRRRAGIGPQISIREEKAAAGMTQTWTKPPSTTT